MSSSERIQSKENQTVKLTLLLVDRVVTGNEKEGSTTFVVSEDSLSLLKPYIGKELTIKSSQNTFYPEGMAGYPDVTCISSEKSLNGILLEIDNQGLNFLINNGEVTHITGGYNSTCKPGHERILYKKITSTIKGDIHQEESVETEKVDQIVAENKTFSFQECLDNFTQR